MLGREPFEYRNWIWLTAEETLESIPVKVRGKLGCTRTKMLPVATELSRRTNWFGLAASAILAPHF